MASVVLSTAPPSPGAGTPVIITAAVTNDAGVATNPADITFVVEKPDGTQTTVPKASMTSTVVGTWTYAFTADLPGSYVFRVLSTTPTAAEEATFATEESDTLHQRDLSEGPCEAWASPATVTDGWTAPAGLTASMLQRACDAASNVCFELGGRRWPGICWDSVQPALVRGSVVGGAFTVWPVTGGGLGVLPGVVSSTRPYLGGEEWLGQELLDLGAEPIVNVQQVRLSGVVLAATSYKVVDGRYLVRVDGSGWPMPNDPSFNPPTIAVDFTYGATPPPIGILAAIALSRQLGYSIAAPDDCTLNRRVKQVLREGVVLDLAVPGLIDNLREGFTGVPEVDLFVASLNPHKLRRAARVVVPGQQFPHRVY